MRRIAVPLIIALMLAALAGAAEARPQPYPGIGHPSPQRPASTPIQMATVSNDGPSWTVAILGGVAVIVAVGGVGVLAGRASARPQVR